MNGLKPIKIPSAKEKVASELRKAILSRKMKEGEILSLDISDSCERWTD